MANDDTHPRRAYDKDGREIPTAMLTLTRIDAADGVGAENRIVASERPEQPVFEIKQVRRGDPSRVGMILATMS